MITVLGNLWNFSSFFKNCRWFYFSCACEYSLLFVSTYRKLTAVVLLRKAHTSHKDPRAFSFLAGIGRKVGNSDLVHGSAGAESINLSLFIL